MSGLNYREDLVTNNKNAKGTTYNGLTYEDLGELVKKFQNGDEGAFQKIYDATWRSVYFLLMKKVGYDEDTQELTQDVYIQVFKSLKSLENPNAFIAWINRIAYTKYVGYLRKKDKFEEDESYYTLSEDIVELDREFIPEEMLIREETSRLVYEAVENLPEQQRLAIVMYYYQNLSVAELAYATDSSENTVYKRLFDARKSIKQRLEAIVGKGVSTYALVPHAILILTTILKESASKNIQDHIGKEIWNRILPELHSADVKVPKKKSLQNSGLVTKTSMVFMTALAVTGAVVALNNIPVTKDDVPKISPQIETEENIFQPDLQNGYISDDIFIPENDVVEQNEPENISPDVHEQPVDSAVNEIIDNTDTNTNTNTANPIESPVAEAFDHMESPEETAPQALSEEATDEIMQPIYIYNVELAYQLGDNIPTEQFLTDVSQMAGNSFSPENGEIEGNPTSLLFDKIGKSTFYLNVVTDKYGDEIEITANVTIVDSKSPEIHIRDKIDIEQGTTVALEEILLMGEFEITDNSNEEISADIQGYENINFGKVGRYPMTINGTDSNGNIAPQKVFIVNIIEPIKNRPPTETDIPTETEIGEAVDTIN